MLVLEKFKNLLLTSGYKTDRFITECEQIVEGYKYFHVVVEQDDGTWHYMQFDKKTGNLDNYLGFDAYACAMLAFAEGIAEEFRG